MKDKQSNSLYVFTCLANEAVFLTEHQVEARTVEHDSNRGVAAKKLRILKGDLYNQQNVKVSIKDSPFQYQSKWEVCSQSILLFLSYSTELWPEKCSQNIMSLWSRFLAFWEIRCHNFLFLDVLWKWLYNNYWTDRQKNMVEGCGIVQGRTHWILVGIWTKCHSSWWMNC